MTSKLENHDEHHLELASLYALQVLPDTESSAFEIHLKGCDICRREVDATRADVESFVEWPTDVLRPAASLWNQIAERISPPPQATPILETIPGSKPEWQEVAQGISCSVLSVDTPRQRVTMLVRLAPGTDYPSHRHADIEELHLLDGILIVDEKVLHPGDFIHAEAGSMDHRVWSKTGCTCVLMTSTNDTIL